MNEPMHAARLLSPSRTADRLVGSWIAACWKRWRGITCGLALTLALLPAVGCGDDATDDAGDVGSDTNESDGTDDTTISDDTGPDDATADVDLVRVCNGNENLCDRPFNEVVFPTTHNSMSNDEEGWIAPNHTYPIEWQLESGIRAMLLDVYEQNDELVLCHSVCAAGSRDFVEALTAIRVFLEAHDDDVFTFIIQNAISSAQLAEAFEASGLLPMVYTYEGGDWPTLAEMADSGERVLVTVESGGAPPAWVHHAWDVMFDTPYSFETADDFNCDVNRGSAEHSLFLMNHWISNPLSQASNAEIANTYEVLGGRARACAAERGQVPNFVAVDFSSIGALQQVVDELNGL